MGVDRQLRELAIGRNRISYQVCVGLRRARELRAHELGGFGSFREYARRLFGYAGSRTEERRRVAERLEELWEIAAAFARGDLTFSAVRELTRVATSGTETDRDHSSGRGAHRAKRAPGELNHPQPRLSPSTPAERRLNPA